VAKVGEPAPDFSARTTDGRTLRLSEMRGRYVVLYFFPKAFSPLCNRETSRFRDAYPDIAQLGGEVLGISVDDFETQCDYAEKMQVTFPMIADDNQEISRRYGVLRAFIKLPKRITYLIDRDGTIRGIFAHEFQISRHLDDVLHFLEKVVGGEAAER